MYPETPIVAFGGAVIASLVTVVVFLANLYRGLQKEKDALAAELTARAERELATERGRTDKLAALADLVIRADNRGIKPERNR